MPPAIDAVASLDEAETAFQAAFVGDDVAALDVLLHDDVRFTGPDGRTIDKATDLELHRAKAVVVDSAVELDRQAQVVDGVGITRVTLHVVGAIGGQAVDLVLAYTRVWAAAPNGWRIVAAHAGPGVRR